MTMLYFALFVRNELLKPVDRPTKLTQAILDNEQILRQLITNGNNKDAILNKTIGIIDSYDPQEKLLLSQLLFDKMSDSNNSQNQRDGALEILRVMDLKEVNQEKLVQRYIETVDGLEKDADPYGEVDTLLEAGKIIAPFLSTNKQGVKSVWDHVALSFTGGEYTYIINKNSELQASIPTNLSAFEIEVQRLRNEGQSYRQMAQRLNVPPSSIGNAVKRLITKGATEPKPRKRQRAHTLELDLRVKELTDKGFSNTQIAKELDKTESQVSDAIGRLLTKG